MKIAITFLLTGSGHYREALAIKKYLRRSGHEVDLIYPIENIKKKGGVAAKVIYYISTIPINITEFIFQHFSFSKTNGLNENLGFRTHIVKIVFAVISLMERIYGKLVSKSLGLEKYDCIISTHPMATNLSLGALKKKTTVINVCPDEVGMAGALFYKVNGVLNLVNSENVRSLFIKAGLPPKNVMVLGHPLDTEILQKRKKIYERVQKDLKKGKMCIGLYIGGYGPKSQQHAIFDVIRELSEEEKKGNISLKILTGLHRGFENEINHLITELGLRERGIEINRTKTYYELVEVGHLWMLDDINVMFSRPSELVFYSLATGIPHILFPPVGIQELDMFSLLIRHANVLEYQQIKGSLKKYLTRGDELALVSRGLYNSNYNLSGAINIGKFIEA